MKKEIDVDRGLYIAGLIEKYLQNKPDAMDDFEGIRAWWITQQKIHESTYLVSYALDLLIAKGVVEKVNKSFYRYARMQ